MDVNNIYNKKLAKSKRVGNKDKDNSSINSNDTHDNIIQNLQRWYDNRKNNYTKSISSDEKVPSSNGDTPSSFRLNNLNLPSNDIEVNHIPQDKVLVNKRLLNNILNDQIKTSDILHQMLPGRVVDQLNKGLQVVPQEFANVTIFFSDIVGFTDIAAKVHPLFIVLLLQQLYSVFDYCATFFPLFKVMLSLLLTLLVLL
jgi:hypothetical protein